MKPHFLFWPLLVMSALGHAQVPDEGLQFSHKDWDLACNKTDECLAMGYSPGDGIDGVSLALQREAGPDAPIRGYLLYADIKAEPPVVPVRLMLDSADLGELNQDGDTSFSLSEDQVEALVGRLSASVEITFVDSQGNSRTLSDAGAAAVLIKMDELQERLGTPGAAIRKGDENEEWVPRPRRRPPTVEHPPLVENRPGDAQLADDPALRQALVRAVNTLHPCPDLEAGNSAKPLTIERLDEHRLVVSTQCSANSFNTATGFWVVEDRPPYLAQLVTEAGTQFDRRYAQISSWQLRRALGDCQVHSYWVWDGMRFVLSYRNDYNRCRGFRYGAWSLPTYLR